MSQFSVPFLTYMSNVVLFWFLALHASYSLTVFTFLLYSLTVHVGIAYFLALQVFCSLEVFDFTFILTCRVYFVLKLFLTSLNISYSPSYMKFPVYC